MNPDELASVAAHFGVARAQVERDHLISYLLGHLSAHFADRVVFIGGTALARMHLVDGRLSEDIDLIAVGSRSEVARDLDGALPRAVMRSHGRLVWDPAITGVPEQLGDVLRSKSGLAVKVQLLSAGGRPAWPLESRQLEQREFDDTDDPFFDVAVWFRRGSQPYPSSGCVVLCRHQSHM